MEKNDWKTLDVKPKPNFPIEAEVERDFTKADESWWKKGSKGHVLACVRVEDNKYRTLSTFQRRGARKNLFFSGNKIIRWRYKPNYLGTSEE